MLAEQNIRTLGLSDVLPAVQRLREQGYRLVQICCTKLDRYELTYSFAKDNRFDHLRTHVDDPATPIPSVTGIYFGAFAYENELHDLFGLNITGNQVDYKGSFIKPYVGTPFAAGCAIPTAKAPNE